MYVLGTTGVSKLEEFSEDKKIQQLLTAFEAFCWWVDRQKDRHLAERQKDRKLTERKDQKESLIS